MILTSTLPLLLAAATLSPPSPLKVELAPGQLRFESGVLSAPSTLRLEDAARAFVASRKDLALAPGSTLGKAKIFGTRFGASVHLPQELNGVPVDGASVVVTFDRDKRVVQVASNLLPYKTFTTFTFAPQRAMDAAGRAVQAALIQSNGHFYGTWTRRYFVVGDEARAGYLVYSPTLFPDENWYSAVDAVTGEILFKQNRVFNAANDAQAYARDPGGLDAGVGVTPTVPVSLSYLRADAGDKLSGDRIVAWGCCTVENCDGGAPARIAGDINVFGFNVRYDAGICQRTQRASNDPLVHGTADFVYTPVDPPNPICNNQGVCSARPGDPADIEPFSEVNAYHQLNQVYDFVRTLSGDAGTIVGEQVPLFDLREVSNGRQTAAWANITVPDRAELEGRVNPFTNPPSTFSDKLAHVDNAAFMPRENAQEQILPPSYAFDTDAFMLFQGDKADFAYDGPVVWHEFGHGMLYALGVGLEGVAFDSRSANNETGAIHESMGDWLAAAYGQDPRVGSYVGPRGIGPAGSPTLRSADNTFKCPDVLWGQVHQDSMHVTGAVWEARKELFQGNDQGRTFDAVVYAALAAVPANANFQDLANAIATRVQVAFPGVINAEQKIRAIFDNRGVTNCSKVLDITNTPAPQRQIFMIADRSSANLPGGQHVPGPFQFKLTVPNGAKSIAILGLPTQGGGFGGQATAPPLRLLVKKGQPITFNKTVSSVTHNADATATATLPAGSQTATARVNNLNIECGAEVYLALTASAATTVQPVNFVVDALDTCVMDAGVTAPDAGSAKSVPAIDEGGAGGGGTAAPGCGCNGGGSVLLFGLGALALFRRRRQ